MSTPPTIDGQKGAPEWDSATTFPVSFGGGVTGTAFVERTASNLYIAYQVSDPTGGLGDAAVYFDNVDNGTLDVGDDLLGLPTSGAAQDSYISSVDFPAYNSFLDTQAPGGGTSDVRAAASRDAGGTIFVEFEHALCANDPGHDICFIPPAPNGDASRIGFQLFYNGNGNNGIGVSGIGGWANLQISPTPDTTPPSAPTLSVKSGAAFYDSTAAVLYYRASTFGQFTFIANGSDPESGIASATFPSAQALGPGWDTGATGGTTLNYFFPNSDTNPPPPGQWQVTLTNGAGLEGPPTLFQFDVDGQAPTNGQITCAPVSCTNDSGPVTVTVNASDNASGVQFLRYTTDGTDPSSGTVIAPGGSFQVNYPNTPVSLWGVDNVGNGAVLTDPITVNGSFATRPNGNILYESTRPSAADETVATIWQADPNTGAESQITTAPAELHPAVAGDGSKIAWTGTNVDGQSFIVVANRDGSNAQAITQGPHDDWPAISADGTKIAFSRDTGNGLHDIYVANIDGSNAVDVTEGSGRDNLRPSWSPDGLQIVYGASNGENPRGGINYDIFVQDAQAGADPANLTSTQDVVERDPSWSPKGDKIAFSSNNGHTWPQVWVMDRNGANAVDLTDSYPNFNDAGDQNSDPSFSPDGSQIAFVFSPGGTQNFDVYRMNADGTKRTPVFKTPNGTHEGYPAWAPRAADTAQSGPTFTVNTADDHDDGVCGPADCTFREAINAANAYSDAAAIHFAIPTPAPTIQPTSQLPAIAHPTDVDATTQGGSIVGPPVVLDGSLSGGGDGIVVTASGSAVHGFLVEHFSGIGIHVLDAGNVLITDNWSGIGTTGLVGAGNAGDGIRAEGSAAVQIRSNVVGANGGHGIFLLDTTKSLVSGNKSGTNAGGTAALGNGLDGIAVDGGGGNRIASNVSSGNLHQGISLFGVSFPITSGNIVQDNRVGLAADSAQTIPNVGDGIRLFNAADNVVGGTGDNQSNTIAGNGGAGIAVFNAVSTGNTIRANSIFGNTGLGIDLGGDGVTPNDSADGDLGPNDLTNFPVLAPPLQTGGTINVSAKLVALPNTHYTIDAFANTACQPGRTSFGEGQTYVGSVDVATDDTGAAPVVLAFGAPDTLPAGVTLTATDLDNHETSEFSQCVAPTVAGQTRAASLTLTSNTGSSEAGASVVPLDGLPRDAFMTPAPPDAPIESSPIESSPIESSPIESSPIESSPIESSPIESSPIESSPIESSPIESSPIESSGFTPDNLRQNGLGGVPLSQLVLKAPKTWAGVVGHAVVEQSTTLADVLTPPVPVGVANLKVSDIDWARSQTALASLGVGALVYGAAKLSDIRPLADWCASIDAAQGFQCTDPTTLASKTVMDIALQGVPIESSGVSCSTPIESSTLGCAPIESSDLSDIPIESSPITPAMLHGTPIESSPLSSVDMQVSVLGSIPISAVIAAGSPIGLLPLAQTLVAGNPNAQVRALGAALNTFTIGDLKVYPGVTVGNIGPGLPANLTLRDLLKAIFAVVPFDPDTMPLAGIQEFASAGGLVTYTATFSFTGVGNGATGQLRALLASGARYVLHSAKLDGVAYGDPGVIGDELAWQLTGLTYGGTHTLSWQVNPSLQLGTDTTKARLLPLGTDVAPTDTRGVTVTDTFESNDTPATAKPIAANKLYLSFEQTQADTDWFSIPVPAAGTVTTFTLSHLANDKDLVVYAPAVTPFRSAPIESSPIESSPIESSGTGGDSVPTLQQGSSPIAPSAVQDVPIESSQLGSKVIAGISDNAGTSDESVTVVASGAQQGGSYLVHIVSADPTPTSTPYALRADVQAPPTLPQCTPRPAFPFAGQGAAGALPAFGGVPASVRTMVLVNYKRYGDTFGTAALNRLKAELATFVARPEVAGVIMPVEGSTPVANAYTAWDATPCAPEKANDVVRAIISNIIDPFRSTHPNIKFLTIVGGDDIVPFPRVVDNTTTANESSYLDTIGLNGATPVNNELVGTAASGYMETDDVWSGFNPLPFLGGWLYKPQWATGRLVETTLQIDNQLTTYNTTGGVINPTTQLVAGYDFLADSAGAVATALAPAVGSPLINNTWNRSDLLTKLTLGLTSPAIVALNMHYDHHRGLPANLDTTNLFSSTDVNATPNVLTNAELGRLIFSIGCHSGYTVPNFLYTSPFNFDWAEADMSARAIARIANTTYGYGDTDVIGYSEQVEVGFASRLRQSTLGEALMFAKQQYYADLGPSAIGPYEQKSMNALTFYGLPMQRIGTPVPPAAPPAPTTTTDAVTGLASLPVISNVTFGAPVPTASGAYFNGPNGVDATNNRPFEPKRIIGGITVPNTQPHGFLITQVTIDPTSAQHFHAARSRAVPDAANLTPPLSSQVGYPSDLGRISSFLGPNGPQQQLVLVHGQFLSDTESDTNGLGTQTNFSQIKGTVLYSPSNDGLPPQLANIRVTRVGNTVAFALDATDALNTTGAPGTVKEVIVVYYEPGAPLSHTAVLARNGTTNHWTGAGPLASSSVDSINYFAQGVDASGNVGISVHKVAAAPVTLEQGNGGNGDAITFSVTGSQSGGYYTPSAGVALSAPSGYAISYTVDGGALRSYTGSFSISGDGLHIVDASAQNASGEIITGSVAVPIDTAAPTISILSPVDGQYALVGVPVPALYSCADAGSGLADPNGCVGPVPSGSSVTNTTTGTKTFSVTARDVLGHTQTVTVTYRVFKTAGDAIVALADKTVQYLGGNPLGAVLKAQLTIVANAVVARNPQLACLTLNLYIAAVKGASPSVLTQAKKDDLVADATRIKVLIGCTS